MSHAERPHLLILSAENEIVLTQRASDLADRMEAHPDHSIAEVAAKLQAEAGDGVHRRAFVASTREIAISALRGFEPRRTFCGHADANNRLVFMFPGQGAQYLGMGAQLYAEEPIFRSAFDECSEILHGEIDLAGIVQPGAPNAASTRAALREARLAQPAIFATSYALARLWMAWGLRPSACVGHSVGEYVAATIAGVFSLPDALRIVATRAKLVQAQPPGAMLAVHLSESDAARYLNRHVALAAVNAPDVTVLSGSDKAISILELELAADSVAAVRVETSHAFHSPMMDAVIDPLQQTVFPMARHAPNIPILSTITGDWLTDGQAKDSTYWANHVRKTVRFAPAIARLQKEGPVLFLECGPGQNLGQLVRHHHAPNSTVLSSIREHVDERQSMCSALAQLWTRGVTIDWHTARPVESRPKVAVEAAPRSFSGTEAMSPAVLPLPPRPLVSPRTAQTSEAFTILPPPPTRPKAAIVEDEVDVALPSMDWTSQLPAEEVPAASATPDTPANEGPEVEVALPAEESLQQAETRDEEFLPPKAVDDTLEHLPEAIAPEPINEGLVDVTLNVPLDPELTQKVADLTAVLNAHLEQREIPLRWESFSSVYFLRIPNELPNAALIFSHMRLQGIHIWSNRPCVLQRNHSGDDVAKVVDAFKAATDSLVSAKLLPGCIPVALPIQGTARIEEPPLTESIVEPKTSEAEPMEVAEAIAEVAIPEIEASNPNAVSPESTDTCLDVSPEAIPEPAEEIISLEEFLASEAFVEPEASANSVVPPKSDASVISGPSPSSVVSTEPEPFIEPQTPAPPNTPASQEAVVPEPSEEMALEMAESTPETIAIPPEWNGTARAYPSDMGLDTLFEEVVSKRGSAIAVTDGRRSISYDALNVQANMLANRLTTAGVKPGGTVGICLERSVEAIAATLAIVKIGCAYVPLDPSWPGARLQAIAQDAQCATVITKLDHARYFGGNATLLDGPRPPLPPSADDPNIRTVGSAAAYVMYTSGSTGAPKGVVVPHRAVGRLVLNTDYVPLTENDVVAHASNPAFDAATFEIWGPLLNGGRIVVLTRQTMRDATDIGAAIRDEGITTMFVTSALLNKVAAFATGVFKPLRHLLVGGDVLNPRMVARILRHGAPLRFLNVYGPTEATTFACAHLITEVPATATSIPIGRPITNTEAYILDADLKPVPIGAEGELFLGGDGLALGYHGDPKLTAEHFVESPFSAGHRLYRTGDRACWLADGTIEFLGRRDGQVKLRGIRVELAEVEAELASHPRVAEAAVRAFPGPADDKVLAGYFVTRDGDPPETDEIRAYLRRRLPEHMVPATVTRLDQLPITENGKVDRGALPMPERPTAIQLPPVLNSIEVRVAELMAATLGLPSVELGEDFFRLGGQSLLAMDLLARLRKAFGVEVPSSVLLESPNVKGLAQFISEHQPRAVAEADFRFLVPIQRGSPDKTPLFLVAGGYGGEIEFLIYAQLARQIDPAQPVYGLKARGVGTAEPAHASASEMAADYLEEIRTLQPCGPYLLAGEWVGGVCAHEMACQLRDAGEQVDQLILLNTSVPGPDELANYLAQEDQGKDDPAKTGGRMRRYLDKMSSLAMPGKVRQFIDRATGKGPAVVLPVPATQHPRGIVEYPPTLLRHHLRKYAGRVTLFVDEESAVLHGQLGWENAAVGDLDAHILPGTRVTYLRENAAHAAAALREVLSGAVMQH